MDLTEFIADSLFTVHGFLAGLSGEDIWKIERDEAHKLGGAITNVTRHYDIPGLDQKTVDWVRLFQMAGMVYGTRIFAANMKARSNAAKPVQSRPMTASENAPQRPAPGLQVVMQPIPEKPQPSQREKDGGTWASPGPGLPPVFIADK